jgi:hypothetical protein
MSYSINKTNGTLLTELVDGTVDKNSTDLVLVGRNYSGFGEFINENFVRLVENFSNTNAPVNPLQGQLWYDTSENKLKVFDGSQFQSAAGSFVTNNNPTGPVAGDTWFKTDDRQFYFWDGTEWILIGPQYNRGQGPSGVFAQTIQDRNLNSKTVLKILINDVLQFVISKEEFIPNDEPGNIISELITESNTNGTIFKGINVVDKNSFVFGGSAESTQNIASNTGELVQLSQLIRNDENGVIQGSLGLRSSAGLTLGASQGSRFVIDNGLTIQNILEDDDVHIKINSSQSSLSAIDAITVKSKDQRVGIFQDNPEFGLDVTGDVRITGDLTVEGDSFRAQVGTLEVEDKNILIAKTDSPSDTLASGGGITLKATVDKTILYNNSTQSWDFSENINIPSGKEYRINGLAVLDSTQLHDSITTATGLTQIGTLSELTVDNINVNGSVISRINGNGLTLDAGDIAVSNGKITGVNSPTDLADAANKVYVDENIAKEPIVFAIDVTGWVTPTDIVNSELLSLLEELYPASTLANGKQANIATFWYGTQTIGNIDVDSSTSTSEVLVESSAGGSVSVIQDISLPNDLSATFSPTVQRQVRKYIISSGVWIVNN